MEEFSQSRGDDSLFDDEIIPIQPSQQSELAEQVKQLKLQQSAADNSQGQSSQSERGRGRGRGRGWKRGHGPVQINRGGLTASKFAPKQAEPIPSKPPEQQQAESQPIAEEKPTAEKQEKTEEMPAASSESAPPPDAPTGPSAQSQPKTPAVRGDRTATGGVRKPKLSEDELSARLAAAKAKSQSLAEQHARAQADAADFEERERVAQHKRKEEEKSRRALEGEREKNRARKMQAVGGREWDAEKNEEDFKEKRYGERNRRGPPGPEEQDLSIYEWREEGDRGRGGGRGRGRGRGRGEFRGRGRGRGSDSAAPARTPDVKAVEDFPALPAKPGELQATKAGQQLKEPETAGGSWADQMAS